MVSSKKIISLNALLNREFRNRIGFVFVTIFMAATLMAIFEISVAFKQFRQKLKLEADNLQSLVMSEIIVHRESSIAQILQAQNQKDAQWTVTWNKEYSKSREAFLFKPPFNLQYIYPLQILSGPVYGALVFNSHLLSQPDILEIFVEKICLMLIIYLAMAAAILPLAKKIPKRLILEPIQKIVEGVKNETFDFVENSTAPYLELVSLQADLKKIITDKKRLEDERVEVQKLSSAARTAQLLAHDIRKPMTLVHAVMKSLEVMKDPAKIQKFACEAQKRVQNACEQMDQIFKELTLLKNDSCRNFQTVFVKEVVDAVTSETGLIFQDKCYNLSVDVPSNLEIEIDECSFKRALSNLLCNAIEATPEGGKVWIGVNELSSAEKTSVRFTVGNSGSFISKEDQSKVFHLFYSAGKEKGSGLGLPIVQQILRTHQAYIWIESSEAKGTEFIFDIPKRQKKFQPHDLLPFKKFVKFKDAEGPLKVLVIDDEEFNLLLVTQALKEFDLKFDVVSCQKSNEAINLACKTQFDLIISDIRMGKGQLDGFEITENLRQKGVDSFIYIHTSGLEKDNKELAIKAGANLFGNKPFLDTQIKLITQTIGS